MKSYILLWSLTFSPLLGISQKNGSVNELISLKFTPTAMLNLIRPTVLVGIELKPSPDLGFQFEYGFQSPTPIIRDCNYFYFRRNCHFRRIKIEVRRHTFFGNRATHYQAFGVGNFADEFLANPGVLTYRDKTQVRHSSAQIFRTEWVGYFLFGSKIWSSDNFYFDIYSGLGYRRMTIDYGFVELVSVVGSREVPERNFFDGDPGHRYERSVGLPYVDFGVKLAYSF